MPVESFINKTSRMSEIVLRLKKEYPESKCSLIYDSPFQLLVATILSAQCTDERVNRVTKVLFSKYPTVKSLFELSLSALKKEIFSTDFIIIKQNQ